MFCHSQVYTVTDKRRKIIKSILHIYSLSLQGSFHPNYRNTVFTTLLKLKSLFKHFDPYIYISQSQQVMKQQMTCTLFAVADFFTVIFWRISNLMFWRTWLRCECWDCTKKTSSSFKLQQYSFGYHQVRSCTNIFSDNSDCSLETCCCCCKRKQIHFQIQNY